MNRRSWLALIAVFAPLMLAPGYYWPIDVIGQNTNMWCWAASSEMLIEYFQPDVDVRQCDMANERFGREDCCNTPTPGACVQGGFLTMVPGQGGGSYGLTSNYGQLSLEQVMDEIDAGRPMGAAIYWQAGGGHTVVINGYFDYISRDYYLYVQDPWPPNSGTGNKWVKWEHFVSSTTYQSGYAPHTLGGFVYNIREQ